MGKVVSLRMRSQGQGVLIEGGGGFRRGRVAGRMGMVGTSVEAVPMEALWLMALVRGEGAKVACREGGVVLVSSCCW